MFCVCRNGWFHFKLRIPCDLVEIVGRSVIQYPLRLRKKRDANKMALELRDRLTPQFQRLRIERLTGASDEQLRSLAHEILPIGKTFRASVDNDTGMSLSELVEVYLRDRSQNVDGRTVLNMRYAYDLFAWIIGDLPIKAINRPQCRDCRDLLLKLPARALQYSDTLTPYKVACLDKAPMSPKTVNKNIQFISALFRWAVNEGLLEDNPARNLAVTVKNKASLERKAYDMTQLRRLFAQLPSSAQSPEEHWLPLMGYYTGMRVEELCQLRTKDIGLLNGVYCLFVSPESGPLKTVNAERIIPIHSELIRLGLVDYRNSVETSGQAKRLWRILVPNKYGKFSSAYTKRFGRFKRKSGLLDSKLTFHSLRHTFVNELKQQGESEHVIAQLIGHANSSITMGRYGKDYNVAVLSAAVERLRIPT